MDMTPDHFADGPHPADVVVDTIRDRDPKLPHSLEAEREVLSVVFIGSAKVVSQLVERVRPEDFFVERHRVVFAVVVELVARNVAVDLVTVRQALQDSGDYERIGGSRALSELLDRAGTVSNVEYYIGILRDKATLRALIRAAQNVEAQAMGDVADVGAFAEQVGKRFERVVGEVARPVQEVPLPTLLQRRKDGQDWLGTPPPEAPVLLRNRDGKPFMRDSRVAALIAPGGTGKTFAFLDLGAGIATGTTWLGTYSCNKGKVGLFLGEEDDDEAWRRLWYITKRMTEIELHDLEQNLVILGMMGHQVALMQRGLDGNIAASPWFRALYESLAKQGPWRALLFDPWSRWGGAEVETDAYAATHGISLLEQLTFLPGRPAVIVAHHTRKMTHGGSHDANDTRGSSAFVDGTRMVANLFRQTESELLELRVTKANYTLPGSPLVLTRDEGGVLRPATPFEIQEAAAEREQRREEAEQRKRDRRKVQGRENTL